MSLSEYKDMFASEATEYLQTLNSRILELEEDPESLSIIDEMFRAAHSLKGMAGTIGFEQIASLTHWMESLFDQLRQKNIYAEKQLIDLLFESLDVLEKLLDQPEDEEEDISEIIDKLGQAINGAEEGNGGEVKFCEGEKEPGDDLDVKINKSTEKGDQVYLLTVELDKECILKSVRAYMVLKELEELGHIIKSIPDEQELEEGTFGDSFQVYAQTKEKPELLKSTIEDISEIKSVDVKIHEDSETKKKEKGSMLEEQQKAILKKTGEKIIRVETEKLDGLIGLVGELVVNRTGVLEINKSIDNPDLNTALEQLDLITTNLQNAVMKLRMVPIKQVFDRFPRLVRDYSQDRNKKVDLFIEGEETELDRSIVNIIGEPLVHLLRNAMDHGIESLEDRKRFNKKESATINLSARHEGSYIVIEVQDDGQGIDPKKIKAKALEKEVKTAAELEQMSDNEINMLVFNSGFSTAEEVTDVSGRGVGMDAVRSTVESLHGEINLDTNVGEGTKCSIKLPLTLAIIKAMLVRVENEVFAIPIEAIRENIYISPKDINSVQKQKVITFREEILQLVSLRTRLHLAEKEKDVGSDGFYSIIVVESGDKKAGLIVDDFLGQQEIVIKSLGKILEGLNGIAGATVMANGEVALILDVSTLV